MARLQILELPASSNDDRPPFVLVVDQARIEDFYPTVEGKSVLQVAQERLSRVDPLDDMAARAGARAVLVFEDTIDIPANDTSGYLPGRPEMVLDVKLGDHVMPSDTTSDDGDLEEAEAVRKRVAKEQKAALTDAFGLDRLRDWDDILNAATGLCRKCDNQSAKIERILRLSETPQQGTGVETSDYLDGYREAIRCALAALINPADDQSGPDA